MNPEIESLFPSTPFTRRSFLISTVASGFALSVQPISAQTITTDTKGLIAGDIKIPTSDGEIPGYHAMPDKKGKFPTILVVQEIFGVHEHIKDICRRLAKVGYLAIAPDLFVRQGDPTKLASSSEIQQKISTKVPDSQMMSDLDASVVWAEKSNRIYVDKKGTKLGITGFCFGGRVTWLYAAHQPKLKAAVAWYGRLAGQGTEVQPKFPIDVVAELKAPVLGLYGGQDQGIPLTMVEEMREKIKAAGKVAEIHVYPEAGHAFNADYRPSYRKDAADDGWKRMLAWFKKYGVA